MAGSVVKSTHCFSGGRVQVSALSVSVSAASTPTHGAHTYTQAQTHTQKMIFVFKKSQGLGWRNGSAFKG